MNTPNKTNDGDEPNIETILGVCLAGGMVLAIQQSKSWVGYSNIGFPEILLHVGFLGALLGSTLILVVSAAVSWILIRVISRQKTFASWAAFIAPICLAWVMFSGSETLHARLKTQGTENSMNSPDVPAAQGEPQTKPTEPITEPRQYSPPRSTESKPQLSDSERQSCLDLLPPEDQIKCFQ